MARQAVSNDPTSQIGNPSHEQIAIRAHQIWEADGRPDGSHEAHWIQAETELCRGGHHDATHASEVTRLRETREDSRAREAQSSNRDRMVDIGRGNLQAGRQHGKRN